MCGYSWRLGGAKLSLIVRGETQRIKFHVGHLHDAGLHEIENAMHGETKIAMNGL